jgi:glycosyltransferase involved in cell wall biosynthesis
MKIAVISAVKPVEGSGFGMTEYAYQLINHLKAIDNTLKIDKIYALPEPRRNNISGLVYANTLFKKKIASIPKDEYDIIHITDHEIGFAAKILKKNKVNSKIITTVHDLSRLEKGLHRGLAQKVYNKLVSSSIKDAIKYSDYILCNSSETYQAIKERFGQTTNMKIVLHGVNDAFITKSIPKKSRRGAFVIGYIGALMKHKNVIFILQAAKILNNKPYKFQLYGTGADASLLIKFKEANNLKNVELLGFLNEKEKIRAYDSFNAFTFPSLYEGMGYPILEAQSRGLPVIIYKYSKIPKEVRKYCFEAESPEHMAQIIMQLKENGYNEKLRKKATEYARSFTWEKCARETLEVYKRCLGNEKS